MTMNIFNPHARKQYFLNINFGKVKNKTEVIEKLQVLPEEIDKAEKSGLIEPKMAAQVKDELNQAIIQVKEPEANQKKAVVHLKSAISLLKGITTATGLIEVLIKAVEAVQKFIK
jgi:hypothetical protein